MGQPPRLVLNVQRWETRSYLALETPSFYYFFVVCLIKLINLTGGWLLYSIVVVFATHWHESAMENMFLHPEPPFHLPPHPIPLGCPRAPAMSALSHASNLDWWSVSHMIIYTFQWYSLKSSHPRLLPQSPKSVLYICVETPNLSPSRK